MEDINRVYNMASDSEDGSVIPAAPGMDQVNLQLAQVLQQMQVMQENHQQLIQQQQLLQQQLDAERLSREAASQSMIFSTQQQSQQQQLQQAQQQLAGGQPPQPKIEAPKAFKGEKIDSATVEAWIFQMELFFQATGTTPDRMAMRAALNMEGPAAVWLQAQGWNLQLISWPQLQQALRFAFKPADAALRARDQLFQIKQTGGVVGYTTAFRQALIQCHDVGDAECLYRYIQGLKDGPRQWVRMHNPQNLAQAAQIAERWDSTHRQTDDNQRKRNDDKQKQNRSADPKPQDNTKKFPKTYQKQGNGSQDSSKKFQGKCFTCGKIGHRSSECRSKQASLNKILAMLQQHSQTEKTTEKSEN